MMYTQLAQKHDMYRSIFKSKKKFEIQRQVIFYLLHYLTPQVVHTIHLPQTESQKY